MVTGDETTLIPQLLNTFQKNINIAYYGFSDSAYKYFDFTNDADYINHFFSFDEYRLLSRAGTTNTINALNAGYNFLKTNSRNNSNKFLILITDGGPTYDNEGNGISYTPNGDIEQNPSNTKDTTLSRIFSDTQAVWQQIINDTDIHSFVIGVPHDLAFDQIFGNGPNTLYISDPNTLVSSISNNLYNFITNTSTTSTTTENPTTTYNNFTEENKSYAVDSQERRLEVMNYSTNIDYTKASILDYSNLSNTNKFIEKTYMIASTPYFYVMGQDVSDINLALEERPKSSVEITKKVSHLTITLSDGNTLIDWKPTQTVDYLMVLPDSLTAIMDDEITHGATIRIDYTIQIFNKGEIDNLSNYFTEEFLNNTKNSGTHSEWFNMLNSTFNTQEISSIINEIIPTKYYLYDYLENTLIFDEVNSPNYWSIVNNNSILPTSLDINSNTHTILEAHLLNDIPFYPQENGKEMKLIGSKVMTIADTDLLTYNNFVEVVQYSNLLGRRMYNCIPGNFDVNDEERIQNLESDESKAETVTRVPPFGKDFSYYTTIVGIIILAIEIVVLSTLKIKIKNLRSRYIRK